ncbi:unnamed protein product, partial [marine sediment metagenome]
LLCKRTGGWFTELKLYDMKTDPGQRLNVAVVYPEQYKKMRALYEEWFDDVFSDYKTRSYIQIGTEEASEMVLSSHDWMEVVKPDGTRAAKPGGEDTPPFAHSIIRRGKLLNGYWDVEIMSAGEYEIKLMRWPEEAGRAIREGIPASTTPIPGGKPFGEGKALDIDNARLEIQGFENSMTVTDEMKSAPFIVDLEKGKTKLKTWFTGKDDLSLGAYYVYISKAE